MMLEMRTGDLVKLPGLLLSTVMLFAAQAHAATAQHLVVVELFTSQGCSSCPPANESLRAIADRTDVLALSFDVTYWDYLGWKDIFDNEFYTQRQRDYEAPLGEAGPFTPQIVVDGARDTVGDDYGALEQLVVASHRTDTPAIALTANSVTVGSGSGAADVWLVRYDPRLQHVPVARGENAGYTLTQRNVVRALSRIGGWNGQAIQFTIPAAPAGLKTAVLLQRPRGGAILTAARD